MINYIIFGRICQVKIQGGKYGQAGVKKAEVKKYRKG